MTRFFIAALIVAVEFSSATAIPKYNEGMVVVKGVQFLQDREDSSAYYYIPQFPRLSKNDNGSYELLCLKYVGQGGSETNGGIFHALIEFSLPQELLDILETSLKEKTGNAKAFIAGPVPLSQTMKEGENNSPAGFQVVSSILTNTAGTNAFTRKMVASGHAPLLPGSKAAISALLSQEGATLLFESLQGPTSDVSVTISGYYEAAVKAYNAVATASCSTMYEHYSRLTHVAEGFTRDELRKVTDQLRQNQLLKVDVFDRSAGLGIDTKDMQAILSTVTDKLIELMFDAKEGWSQTPPTEVAVEMNQIKGRQERGWFSSVFGGAQNTPYFSDNQFVLKKRTDIRVHNFYLNLSKSTTIKVPVYTSGNLGGLYDTLSTGADSLKYFRLVNLNDGSFEKRDIIFQVDGEFADSFKDILNFVTVSFRKVYGGNHNDVTGDKTFKRGDLEKGGDIQSISYPRLNIFSSDWLDYEYRVSWSLRGENLVVRDPPNESQWKKSKASAVSLIPPFKRRTVEVDADRALFKEAKKVSATVRFAVQVAGKPVQQRSITLRANDATSTAKVTLYHDPDTPVAYEVVWYDSNGNKKSLGLSVLTTDNYLLLVPPSN